MKIIANVANTSNLLQELNPNTLRNHNSDVLGHIDHFLIGIINDESLYHPKNFSPYLLQ